MEVWLLKARHVFDDDYEPIGIYASEMDVYMAKQLFLIKKEECGLDRKAFNFMEEKYVVGKMEF